MALIPVEKWLFLHSNCTVEHPFPKNAHPELFILDFSFDKKYIDQYLIISNRSHI